MKSQCEKGHAMIELALSAGIMIACLAGTFQFGYTFYVYDELVSAVGNGARYAASRTYRAATPGDIERGTTAIRNMVVYGDPHPAPDAAPVTPNLKPGNVQVTWLKDGAVLKSEAGAGGAPTAVDVTLVNYAVGAMFGSFSFNGKPLAEFPYVGRYAPAEPEP